MMKKIISTSWFFLVLLVSVFGQEEIANNKEQHKTKYQIGFDVSTLVTNILHHDIDELLFSSPQYAFTYKSIHPKNNWAFRLGLGFEIRRRSVEDLDEKVKEDNLRLRIGFEKQKQISKRWLYSVGVDTRLGAGRFTSAFDPGVDPTTTRQFGISPTVGVQFRLTPRLILQTESSIDFSYTEINNIRNFFIFPINEPGSSRDSKNYVANISVPSMLYLTVEF